MHLGCSVDQRNGYPFLIVRHKAGSIPSGRNEKKSRICIIVIYPNIISYICQI